MRRPEPVQRLGMVPSKLGGKWLEGEGCGGRGKRLLI